MRVSDNGSRLLTSVATDTVDLPLTASVHNVPTYHNGQNWFTFELRFGEYPKSDLSYRSVRDHAFTVTGGSVTYVRRLEPGSNVRWKVTVTPSISNTVYLALNATTDCSAQGAICTERGRKLFGRLQLAVAGPDSPPPGTPNTPATGLPTITAGVTGISDGDGLTSATFTYQWLADDADIAGATGSSYTLVAADAGKAITVRVSFTDDGGNEESLTSGPTAAVAEAAPTEPPPAPQNLTAVVNGDGNIVLSWVAPDDGQVTGYRILRRRPILGEDVLLEYVANTRSTAATFTDTNVTAGVQHVYRVQALGAAGQSQRSNYVNVTP